MPSCFLTIVLKLMVGGGGATAVEVGLIVLTVKVMLVRAETQGRHR